MLSKIVSGREKGGRIVLKAEKKLLLWAERHMLLLTVLMAAALGLYLRRAAVWWTAPDAGALFDRHENNIQSSFFLLVVYAAQYLPALPLHTVKWLAGGADYVVALLFAAIACGQKEKLKHTFCFVVCLLSPVVYLRGICWGQIDSVAFAFLLGAYLLWEKGKNFGAVFPAILGAALYPGYFLVIFGWMLSRRKAFGRGDRLCFWGMAVGGIFVLGTAGVFLGEGWMKGLASGIRWISYEPYQGVMLQEPLAWGKQMVNVFGYGAAMLSGIEACRHRIPYAAALLTHLAVLLVYGSLLFPAAIGI